jgi:hypothetical protein
MPLNYGNPIAAYSQPDDPLAMRMIENLPGMAASLGFSTMRGSNTLIRGGFMDDTTRFVKSRSKYGIFLSDEIKSKYNLLPLDKNLPTAATSDSFLFGKRRSLTNKAGKLRDPFAKPSRLNNFTIRRRALTRMHSLSTMTAAEGSGLYTFAQGHRLLNRLPMKSVRAAVGVTDETTALFGPGLFSAIAAGRKLDKLGVKANFTQLETNLTRLATSNNPALLQKVGGVSYSQAANMTPMARGGLTATEYAARNLGASTIESGMTALRAGGEGARGVAGNLMASAMAGPGTRYFAGYFRGAQGFAGAAGLVDDSLRGATTAVQHMAKALGAEGLAGKAGTRFVGEAGAKMLLEGSVLKQLGTGGTLKALGTSTGARVLGARAAALAIPGLQVVAAASLVYDLGKMGGEVIKSGINLARDASMSLQGSINKPMFGMGYRDTEVAATSRARGVMAIQNSRLNARSVLGSEASMMASYFG